MTFWPQKGLVFVVALLGIGCAAPGANTFRPHLVPSTLAGLAPGGQIAVRVGAKRTEVALSPVQAHSDRMHEIWKWNDATSASAVHLESETMEVDHERDFIRPTLWFDGAFAADAGIDPCLIDSFWTAGPGVAVRGGTVVRGVYRYKECRDVREAATQNKVFVYLCKPEKNVTIAYDEAQRLMRLTYNGPLCNDRESGEIPGVTVEIVAIRNVTPWW
jgi:hypothetical protein